MDAHDPTILPKGLPAPVDDGACDHLLLAALPDVMLACTDGSSRSLAQVSADPLVLFFYPRTGVPGRPPTLGFAREEWDSIPGARGCTPQSCGFRDAFGEFTKRHVCVLGVSTNTSAHQSEFKSRERIPYEFLSDVRLLLARAMKLPTFEFPVEPPMPTTLFHRMAWFCTEGRIQKVWYPVFPPNECAPRVLAWLERRGAISIRAIDERDRAFVHEELVHHWHSTHIWSLARKYDAAALPGLVASVNAERSGLLTYVIHPGGRECEVITLSSRQEGLGTGSLLLEEAARIAKSAGCARIFLTTTNDNLRALAFYQRQGWRLRRVFRGGADIARTEKPSLPAISPEGIPIRDELELERLLPRL